MKTILLTTIALFIMTHTQSQDTRRAEDASGLAVGTKAPVFTALDAGGKEFNLSEALKTGPVVMIFYRGHWCPVCNKHLGTIQDSLSLILEKGASVIAVSPQKPEYLDRMGEQTGAEFRLLYDEGYAIADAYDVTFTPPKRTLVMYNTALGAKLKESQTDDSQRLPIPATYIIGKDGVITWRQFDPNYKNRSTVAEILDNIPR